MAKHTTDQTASEYTYAAIETDELNTAPFRITMSIPTWVIAVIDAEAQRIGVSRTAVINTWLVERVDRMRGLR